MQGYRTQVNNSRPAGCLAEQWTNRDNLKAQRETGGTHWCLHDHRPCDSQHEQSLECFEYKQISSQQNRQMHFDQFVLITALNQTLIYFGGDIGVDILLYILDLLHESQFKTSSPVQPEHLWMWTKLQKQAIQKWYYHSKVLELVIFLTQVSYAHQGCFYLIKNSIILKY